MLADISRRARTLQLTPGFNSTGIKVSLLPVKCWAGINVMAPQSESEKKKKRKTTVTHHRHVSTRGPLPQRPLRQGLWNVWREFRTGGAPRVAEVCSTFNKTQPLGYWTKKSRDCVHIGLMDRPTGGLQERWGPETRGGEVKCQRCFCALMQLCGERVGWCRSTERK